MRALFLDAGFLLYCTTAMAVILYLIFTVAPRHGNSNIFVYLAICSLIGSLSVMSVKVSSISVSLELHNLPCLSGRIVERLQTQAFPQQAAPRQQP